MPKQVFNYALVTPRKSVQEYTLRRMSSNKTSKNYRKKYRGQGK